MIRPDMIQPAVGKKQIALRRLVFEALMHADVEIEIGYVTGKIRDLGHRDLEAIAKVVAEYIVKEPAA